jgi:hypothetical protein
VFSKFERSVSSVACIFVRSGFAAELGQIIHIVARHKHFRAEPRNRLVIFRYSFMEHARALRL